MLRPCSKRKKWVAAICVLLIGGLCSVAIFYRLQPPLVTGRKAELEQIVIVERYPGEGGGREGEPKSISTISDKETIAVIYSQLQRACPIKETGGESFYTMVSPRYELTLYYTDHRDKISVFKAGAVRYLGKPDQFTVSNQRTAERIMGLLDSIIDNGEGAP